MSLAQKVTQATLQIQSQGTEFERLSDDIQDQCIKAMFELTNKYQSKLMSIGARKLINTIIIAEAQPAQGAEEVLIELQTQLSQVKDFIFSIVSPEMCEKFEQAFPKKVREFFHLIFDKLKILEKVLYAIYNVHSSHSS